ncbi:Kip1p [Rhizophagus irregularis DAOM 197198w]|uniref:Kip1p n=1 Tax=Rhizophagus irregularis (strain DAOM 197198w) TaxID=1432141 RepID=A0A015NBY8_RHIIW|nr:Kip1p [Rhizophagus irregularis DAOM 197198w]
MSILHNNPNKKPSLNYTLAVRIKPITDEDLEKLPTRFQRQVITTPSPHQIVVEGEKRQFYHFDHVFPPETTQEEIYEKSVENLVDKFLEGYNVTILAYGQTSSGKTHTMGTADNSSIPYHNKGIIPRAIATLFHTMNTSSLYMNRKFSIKVSFIEIYNEDLIDLLGEGEGESRPQVMIREDSKGHIYWSGLQELQVNSVDDVIAYLARGSLNRQVGATDMNAKSSRSHAIFSLTIFDDESDWITITSKFHFVDLAGSERLKRTAASGDRAKEGISINSGLLALGNVISALGDPNKAKHTTHIPYRDSKLTRLLQDSLGGNAQTLMIACVSPAEFNLNETVNTLKYANRARNIKNSAAINQEETGWNDIIHLQNLVVKLRSEISNLKVALSNANSNNGTLSPGRTTPVEGISRIKSPTAGYYSSIPTGRVTPTPGIPTGRSTPTASGIPTGRSTPTTSGIPNGRSTPTSGIPGPSGIPGRSTPTSGIPGPSGIPGRSTPTSGIPGRNTPTKSGISSGIPGRTTPTSGGIPSVITRRTSRPSRPSSPLTTFSHGNYLANNSKDTEAMEDELMQLRASYAELSRKYAKTSAELAMHQDNNPDELHNLKGPVIEEYEKSISSLESNLAMTIAALTHAENALKEIEERNAMLEKNQEQTKSLNNNLQKYIKELESKRDTETKVVTAREDHSEKFVSEAVKVLEERLRDREAAYKELEEKLKRSGVDQEKHVLLNKIDSKDKRISFLDSKLTQLGDEVDKLRRLENKQNSSTMNFYNMSERDQLTIKSLESKLRQTETELDEAKLKYQELQSRLDNSSEFTATPITPMTPMTPATPHNEYNNNNINGSTKLGVHRKAKSLSADLKSENHSAIIEKLQFELKLFESFNKDKQQSLDAVKRELNHLEIDYQETLQLVNDLQEELKKRDGISNSEPANSSNSQLLQEVEKLKEKEKQLLQNIEVHETEHKKHVEEIERLESNIRDLRKQMTEETSDDKNEELMILREYVANNKDYENIIKRLEDELREVKESHNQEKKSTTSSKDNSITNNDESSADKLEQNVDENVIALESTVKNLENKLSSLNLDIKNKDNIIEKELENKGLLQKHLKDKETEVAILTKQLMDLRKQDDDVQRRMKELQAQLGSVKEINKSLESDLDNIKNELKVVKENEAQALEQLQVLDAEELKLQQELAQLRNTEITQRERIAVLEAQLSEKGAQIDNELINVKSELAISKESEITNKETIAQLTKNISEIDNELTNVQSELAISKESEVANKKMIAELESELNIELQ